MDRLTIVALVICITTVIREYSRNRHTTNTTKGITESEKEHAWTSGNVYPPLCIVKMLLFIGVYLFFLFFALYIKVLNRLWVHILKKNQNKQFLQYQWYKKVVVLESLQKLQ